MRPTEVIRRVIFLVATIGLPFYIGLTLYLIVLYALHVVFMFVDPTMEESYQQVVEKYSEHVGKFAMGANLVYILILTGIWHLIN